MRYSRKHRYLFIANPKCASSSIRDWLDKNVTSDYKSHDPHVFCDLCSFGKLGVTFFGPPFALQPLFDSIRPLRGAQPDLNKAIKTMDHIMANKICVCDHHATLQSAVNWLVEGAHSHSLMDTAVYKFTTIRNPLTRLLSCYNYNKFHEKETFSEFLVRLENNDRVMMRFAPTLQHMRGGKFSKFDFDKVIPMENLDAGMEEVARIVSSGRHGWTETHKNSASYHSDVTVTEEDKEKIRNMYKEEMEIGGYVI
jgi:hypothetical protein